jgi:hypothetical protein
VSVADSRVPAARARSSRLSVDAPIPATAPDLWRAVSLLPREPTRARAGPTGPSDAPLTSGQLDGRSRRARRRARRSADRPVSRSAADRHLCDGRRVDRRRLCVERRRIIWIGQRRAVCSKPAGEGDTPRQSVCGVPLCAVSFPENLQARRRRRQCRRGRGVRRVRCSQRVSCRCVCRVVPPFSLLPLDCARESLCCAGQRLMGSRAVRHVSVCRRRCPCVRASVSPFVYSRLRFKISCSLCVIDFGLLCRYSVPIIILNSVYCVQH